MGYQYCVVLGSRDPFYKPSAKNLSKLCSMLLDQGLIELITYGVNKDELSILSNHTIDLIPQDLLIPELSTWTAETIDWYQRMFYIDTDYDPILEYCPNYYEDTDHLRHQPETSIFLDKADFSQLDKISSFAEGRYRFRLALYIPRNFKQLISLQGQGYLGFLYINCGFHVNQTMPIPTDEEQTYFELFPYAPTARKDDNHLLLTHAGSFSIRFLSYEPIFGRYRYSPDQYISLREGVQRFKQHNAIYTMLKPLAEKVLDQELELYLCVDY